MKFGIDFDDTFTADPELWRAFIANAHERGHSCFVVTCRRDTDENRETVAEFVGDLPRWRQLITGLSAKKWFCERQGIEIDVWIDDDPACVLNGK